ncbi:hypothetical protein pdam_00014797 [Pocillopora damicornis]|uniref:Sulfotransferase domain-containing protein n=1 Tax=Pocillopora damicornis TaxID=46731 RepID=A0A3M6U6Q6_POCDA|nr:hypothetical protein pdam_00014797 [Pocillopora damicornis]
MAFLFINKRYCQWRDDSIFATGATRTNWLAEIVSQIYNEGNLSEKRGFLLERALHSHQPNSPTPDLSALPSPRIFKTHLPYNVIPKSPNKDTVCKYIYVARNPKDVVAFHHRGVGRGNFLPNYSLKEMSPGTTGMTMFWTGGSTKMMLTSCLLNMKI